MSKQWWCGQFKERSNRPPWRWAGMTHPVCPLCMKDIGGTKPQCTGRWLR